MDKFNVCYCLNVGSENESVTATFDADLSSKKHDCRQEKIRIKESCVAPAFIGIPNIWFGDGIKVSK